MVRQEPSVYLLIGPDCLSKQERMRRLKDELLAGVSGCFNQDILYAQDLSLRGLQEKLMQLSAGAKRRIVVVKGIESLKKDIRDFLLKYVRDPYPGVALVLDAQELAPEEGFTLGILRYSQVIRFKEALPAVDTFTLSRYISRKQSARSLEILDQLLKNGEKPERIIGGLTYACQRDTADLTRKGRALKLILASDMEIKTGRLRANFALEKLIVGLCGLV